MKVSKVLNQPFRQSSSNLNMEADNNKSYIQASNQQTTQASNKSYREEGNSVNSYPSNQDYAKTSNSISFKGGLTDAVTNTAGKVIAKHPVGIAGLATASVVLQKIVMSGSEALIGPFMDIGIGKAITKATDEKDGRTNQSSKIQAVRTFSQSVGGTITGVAIRSLCIAAFSALCGKIAQNSSSKLYDIINPNKIAKENAYQFAKNNEKWGKSIGGAVAIFVMMFTNFLIDAPFINKINEGATKVTNKAGEKLKALKASKTAKSNEAKEVK